MITKWLKSRRNHAAQGGDCQPGDPQAKARYKKGSVLIITLSMILAITGLGVLAFNTAVTSTQVAGHFAMQKRATYAAEVAMLSGIEYLNWNFEAVVDYATVSGTYEFYRSDPIRPDLSEVNYFSSNPFGNQRLEPFFRVRFSDVSPSRRAAEFDEGFCYVRLRMDGFGGIRDPDRVSEESLGTDPGAPGEGDGNNTMPGGATMPSPITPEEPGDDDGEPPTDEGAVVVTEREMSGGLVTRQLAAHFYVGPVRCPGYQS